MSRRAARTDPVDALRLDQQVCFPLYAASNLLTRLYRPLLAELGLTYPQYLVMLALWQQTPHSVGSLGELLHLDSGTLTPLLKRMEAAGLLERHRDPSDERRVLIALTREGAALRSRAAKVPEALARSIDLSGTELEALRTTVQRLMATLSSAQGDSRVH